MIDLVSTSMSTLVISLIYTKRELNLLLNLYYDHYSNTDVLVFIGNEFITINNDDNIDYLFKYILRRIYRKCHDEFNVNNKLTDDLDNLIELTVKKLCDLFERIEKIIDVSEINNLSINDFEKTASINSEDDINTFFDKLETTE